MAKTGLFKQNSKFDVDIGVILIINVFELVLEQIPAGIIQKNIYVL